MSVLKYHRPLLKELLKQNGEKYQFIVAIEEMSELQKEITKWIRYDSLLTYDNLIEEIADVYIMLEQMKISLSGYDSDNNEYIDAEVLVDEQISKKLDKLEEQIKKGEKIR